MIGIYKITSPSGKIYIGQSWDISLRENNYKYMDCKGQLKLYNSLKKYKWINHKFEIIHELPLDISQDILDQYEILYWKQYKKLGFEMLNIKEPGKGGKHAPETCEKISKTLIGRDISNWKEKIYTKERNEKLSKSLKGRIISEETKNKISKSKLGNKYLLGKKYSQESKLKQSLSHIGLKNRKVSIICINNGKIFNSIKETSEILNIGISSIKNILSGKNKQTRNKLIFKYLNK